MPLSQAPYFVQHEQRALCRDGYGSVVLISEVSGHVVGPERLVFVVLGNYVYYDRASWKENHVTCKGAD